MRRHPPKNAERRAKIEVMQRAVRVDVLVASSGCQSPNCDARKSSGDSHRLTSPRVKIISYKRLRATASSELERYVDAFDMFEKRVENRRKFRHVPLTYRLRRHIVSSHAKRQ